MHSTYTVRKGRYELAGLSIPGVQGVYPNPFGEGENVVEIVHDRDPDQLPAVVKDQTCGNVILEPTPFAELERRLAKSTPSPASQPAQGN